MADTVSFEPESHLYLEEVEGEQALMDVKRWNARTLKQLKTDPHYKILESRALEIATSDARIPYGTLRDGHVYNFWQSQTHTRGIWRRTSLESYRTESPEWDVLLDIDALSREEERNWVFKGVECLPESHLCMVALSDGGKDAVVRREFNVADKAFVEGGFFLDEAKSGLEWVDADRLLVATDWGEGTRTQSGYPFIIKLWQRGQKPQEAYEILRGQVEDVGVWPIVYEDETGKRVFGAVESDTFFTSKYWVFDPDFLGKPMQLPLPAKASVRGVFDGQLFVSLEQDWQNAQNQFRNGDLIRLDWQAFLLGHTTKPATDLVYSPGPLQAIDTVSIAKGAVLIALNDNVARKIIAMRPAADGWTFEDLPLPEGGTANVYFAGPREDIAFIGYEDFLTPDTLNAYDSVTGQLEALKSLPAWFEADGYKAEQYTAISSDGTSIPYYVLGPKAAPKPGEVRPTLLYGYGGFQISLNPSYSGNIGKLWLEQGGVYVLANIRGGGEFGPQWHQAGLKTKRQIIYDDFIAVAEDLIKQGRARPEKLGIMGGSNGGLLMGVMYTQRPDLWNAIVCQVPLLDMLRYHKLLAGASWVDEYGSPDVPEERAWLERMSPYHNIDTQAEHPEIFFVTSTKDDRVHPAHARKMAKRLEELGKPFSYYENIDGGHSAAANRKEAARRRALEFTWLAQKLNGPD